MIGRNGRRRYMRAQAMVDGIDVEDKHVEQADRHAG
jgi:hypothetical protein